MRILIIGDTDLDGVGTALVIQHYWKSRTGFWQSLPKIEVMFPKREDLNRLFMDPFAVDRLKQEHDLIYLCDTGLNTKEGNKNLGEILAPKTIYFDHHATNHERQLPYMKAYRGFHVVEGSSCSAEIAYEVLHDDLFGMEVRRGIFNNKLRGEFERIEDFVKLIKDIDLWYKRYPRSTELADYVTEAGPLVAFGELQKICLKPEENTPFIEETLKRVEAKKQTSLALAEATLVKHKGYRTPFYTCLVNGYASWTGHELVHPSGIIGMFNIEDLSLHFRLGSRFIGSAWCKAKGKKPNCLEFAEPLGGGGHPQASGVASTEAIPIFKELSQALGKALLEVKNGYRRRGPANRSINRKNAGRS